MGDYCNPNSDITLLKVPKFLAEEWRRANKGPFLGYCKKGEDGIVQELLVECKEKQQLFLTRDNQLSCPTAVQFRSDNPNVESMGRFKRCLTVYPSLNTMYKNEIKERHLLSNVQKPRGTTYETRNEINNDRTMTLFKYFNPQRKGVEDVLRGITIATPPKQDTPYSRSKNKGQRRDIMDMDELKMSICKVFETDEGKEGLQFKRICQLVNQPSTHVKIAIDEIAEQRKRSSDHKLVYFLRNHFNPEKKKSILAEHINQG